MKSRKEIILETITDFVRSTVAPHMLPRFDVLTKERRKATRKEIARDIAGLPLGVKKKLVGNLKRSGTLDK